LQLSAFVDELSIMDLSPGRVNREGGGLRLWGRFVVRFPEILATTMALGGLISIGKRRFMQIINRLAKDPMCTD
jgi:hypothetical protein